MFLNWLQNTMLFKNVFIKKLVITTENHTQKKF